VEAQTLIVPACGEEDREFIAPPLEKFCGSSATDRRSNAVFRLRAAVPVPQNSTSKWRTLYHAEDEFAAELSNKTVHVV
jgi:hypothetical protein